MNTTLERQAMSGEEIARQAMQTPLQRKIDAALPALKALPQIDHSLWSISSRRGCMRGRFSIPKARRIITKIHKTEHLHVLVTGKLAIFIEGQGWKEYTAPHVGITKPGTRRIIVALEDSIFMTFHPTTKTDIENIERDVIYDPQLDKAIEA